MNGKKQGKGQGVGRRGVNSRKQAPQAMVCQRRRRYKQADKAKRSEIGMHAVEKNLEKTPPRVVRTSNLSAGKATAT